MQLPVLKNGAAAAGTGSEVPRELTAAPSGTGCAARGLEAETRTDARTPVFTQCHSQQPRGKRQCLLIDGGRTCGPSTQRAAQP